MPTFEKRSEMPVPRDALFAYHARPGAIERLIPPFQSARVVEKSDNIRDGARVVIEVQVGPIRQRVVAEHFGYVEGRQFCDRMLNGPFARWEHTHRFEDGPTPGTSVLVDHVEYALPMGALGGLVAGGYVRGELDRMFAFRHARTRNDVARHADVATPLTIAVSGASGAIASNLTPFLTTAGHAVRPLVRDASNGDADRANAIRWNAGTGEVDRERLGACDALVHLAGKNIAVRWTDAAWREIESSRVDATRKLCDTIATMERRPRVMVSASAIGFYGDRGDAAMTEASAAGDDRVAALAAAWEAATRPAVDAGVRVVNLRTGVVLSADSGALPKMATPAKLGVGGPVGGGGQWLSWIAMDDIVNAIDVAIRDERYVGPLNGVTGSVRQRDFADALGRVLHRPSFVPTPAAAVTTLFGEMGQSLLLASTRVEPGVLRANGFEPTWPTLEGALRFELGR